MKNFDWIFALICVFIFRIVAIGASFPDAVCLLAVLSYRFCEKHIEAKKVSDNMIKEITDAKEEIKKAKESIDVVKLASGFGIKRNG
jgi:hypothetical protein